MQEITEYVRAALNGNQKGFEELYRATSRAVYFTCLSLVKNETDAEDLTQEVYITAFEKLPSLSEPEKFAAWVRRIAVNKCRDHLSKKGAHPEYSLDEEAFAGSVDENILPEEYVENKEKRRVVMEIMRKKLSDAQYRTVIMFYFDDMSVAEIAEIMGCPEGTVKYRLNAARSKIREGVLEHEHRTDDRIYAFTGAPFLARLLAAESADLAVPAAELTGLLPAAASAAEAAAGNAADVGVKAFLGTLKGKLVIGAAATAVVGGAVTAVVAVNSSPDITDDSIIPGFSASVPNESSDNADDGYISDGLSVSSTNGGEDGDPTGDYIYEDIPGGIKITRYLGKEEYLTIPAEIDGKKVLEIDVGEDGLYDYAFQRCTSLKSIALPESTEDIGIETFAGCTSLEEIALPDGIRYVHPTAFKDCGNIRIIFNGKSYSAEEFNELGKN